MPDCTMYSVHCTHFAIQYLKGLDGLLIRFNRLDEILEDLWWPFKIQSLNFKLLNVCSASPVRKSLNLRTS